MTNVYYQDYCDKLQLLQQATLDAELALQKLLDNSGYTPGTRVVYEGEFYYVFKQELCNPSALVYWLTLTKLDRNGKMPKKPIQGKYCKSTSVTLATTYVFR